MYDVIIVGSGPAGLAAAIYGERARLSVLVLEREYISGGQVVNTYDVDNYPGLPGIGGYELGMKFREHVDKFGTEFVTAEVKNIIIEDTVKRVETDSEVYEGRTVILAMGAAHRKLGVLGEEELAGMGVSYCATCDGAFFKNRVAAVVGGGDVAVEDALFLARICEKVYLIHRRDQLRAAKILQEKLFACSNVELIWNAEVTEICGEDQVECIKIREKGQESVKVLPVDGVFIAVGTVPNTKEICNNCNKLEMDKAGYILAREDCVTNIPGIYAAGDVRTKKLRQIIIAAADGANAVTSVQEYLNSL